MKCKKGYKKSGDKCVKRNSHSKKNKPFNWDALWIIVTIFGIVIMAGIFFWGGSQGWFTSLTVIGDTDLISFLNMPETISPTCSLSISPNSIWAGDRTTGTIVDGKNKLCHVYVLNGGTWLKAFEGYTDSNGVLTNTRTMNLPGDYIFRAVCDLNNNNRVDTSDCLTNQAELTVIPRPGDSDGDGFTDQEEIDAGTDPFDPNDYPGSNGVPTYTCGWVGEQCDGTCPQSHPLCVDMWYDAGGYPFCACIDPDTGTVHSDWKPDGQYHDDSGFPYEEPEPEYGGIGTIFVTDLIWNGASGGLDGIDAKCQLWAGYAGFSGTWIAIAGDTSINARTRISIDGPFYRVDGVIIANNHADLFDGSIQNPININQNRELETGTAWTGSDGAGYYVSDNCHDWEWVAVSGYYGDISSVGYSWLHDNKEDCGNYKHFYCVRIS